ncbi:unnamed protein product [Malus baccata var. baccata]
MVIDCAVDLGAPMASTQSDILASRERIFENGSEYGTYGALKFSVQSLEHMRYCTYPSVLKACGAPGEVGSRLIHSWTLASSRWPF